VFQLTWEGINEPIAALAVALEAKALLP